MSRLSASLALLLCVLKLVAVTHAASSFPAYRVIQFDAANEAAHRDLEEDDDEIASPILQLGSRQASVHLAATAAKREDDGLTTARQLLNRYAAVVKIGDLDAERFVALVDGRRPGALVILMPSEDQHAEIPDETLAEWYTLEAAILGGKWNSAVYFAHSTPHLEEVYDTLYFGTQAADLYTFSINSGVIPKPVKSLHANNIQSVLQGSAPSNRDPVSNPTIAVIAHYDSFSAVPALPSNSGSGAIAVIELSRMFSRLYADPQSRANYNFVFLLTGAGGLNYNGAEEWLNSTDPAVLEAVDFVLCLDGIGESTDLFLHTSKPKSSDAMDRIFTPLASTASKHGVSLTHVHKKVNLKNPAFAWEHERFAAKRIVAMSLSSSDSPTSPGRHSAFGRPSSPVTLSQNIKAIAEGLATLVFSAASPAIAANPIELFVGDLAVDDNNVAAWSAALRRQSRFAPALDKSKSLVNGLQDALSHRGSKATARRFQVTHSDTILYSDVEGFASVFRVKPVVFEVLLILGAILYVASVYVFMVGPSEAYRRFMGSDSSSSKFD